MNLEDRIRSHFEASIETKQRTLATMLPAVLGASRHMAAVLKAGNKVLACGNGGSAADAQHFAAELTGRYERERPGLAGIALTTDTSALTAIANDYGFEQVFARQIAGLGRRGDALLALSTSGRSPNILAALTTARERGIVTVGMTGERGERLSALCDHLLVAPSNDTPVIQQIHIAVAHGICEAIEQAMMREAPRT